MLSLLHPQFNADDLDALVHRHRNQMYKKDLALADLEDRLREAQEDLDDLRRWNWMRMRDDSVVRGCCCCCCCEFPAGRGGPDKP